MSTLVEEVAMVLMKFNVAAHDLDFDGMASAAINVILARLREPSEELLESISLWVEQFGDEDKILRAIADHLEGASHDK